jgi:hypothetical protein
MVAKSKLKIARVNEIIAKNRLEKEVEVVYASEKILPIFY